MKQAEVKQAEKKSGFMGDAIKLFIITLVAGICLGAVYEITKTPIAAALENTKQKAYKSVYEDASSFEERTDMQQVIDSSAEEIAGLGYGNVVIEKVIDAKDSSGQVEGHVINSTSKDGFGGSVKIAVGIKNDGTVNGIAFLSISESAGLGMNATKPKFYEQYAGKKVEKFTVTKTGAKDDSEINAISGATITSRAVTGAVNAAVYFATNCIKN